MSDEVNRRNDSPNEPTPLDPDLADQLGLGAGGEEDASPSPGFDWTVATPVDPSMDQGEPAPLPGNNPGDHSERVQGPTVPMIVPTTTGGGGTGSGGGGVAGGGVVLRYEWELAGPLPSTPKTGCPDDFVTITPKNKAMGVSVYNGWMRVAFWEVVQARTSVTYKGCYTHIDPTEPDNIGRYSVYGRLDGIAYSDL